MDLSIHSAKGIGYCQLTIKVLDRIPLEVFLDTLEAAKQIL
jgi:hypothetical protein